MKTIKITSVIVLCVFIMAATMGFIRNNAPDCTSCYFQGQAYGDGAESGLSSICNFKCIKGVWHCQGCSGRACDNQQRSSSCKLCTFLNMSYSEGAPSSLNSINYYICHEGSWAKQP